MLSFKHSLTNTKGLQSRFDLSDTSKVGFWMFDFHVIDSDTEKLPSIAAVRQDLFKIFPP